MLRRFLICVTLIGTLVLFGAVGLLSTHAASASGVVSVAVGTPSPDPNYDGG